jgi:hypothetical protein
MATFLHTFSDDGIFGPAYWGWGCMPMPIGHSLYQPHPLGNHTVAPSIPQQDERDICTLQLPVLSIYRPSSLLSGLWHSAFWPMPFLREKAHDGVLCTHSLLEHQQQNISYGLSKRYGLSGKAAWTVYHNSQIHRDRYQGCYSLLYQPGQATCRARPNV